MNPQKLAGDIMGMSQLVDICINTINEDTRVCSPTATIRKGETSKSRDASLNGTFGLGYNKTDKWAATGEVSSGRVKSTSFTNDVSNVELIQNDILGEYCRWDYDYISKNGNKSWNSYLFSSSRVSGQVVYSTGTTKPTSGNRKSKIPKAIKYEIICGAGNKSNGKVANRMGASTNRNMSYDSDTITLSY